MSRATVIVLAALLALAGCGTRQEGPPDIVVDRTACARCGMLVSEPTYAAASTLPGQDPRVFDDIGCLLAEIGAPPAEARHYWFHDAAAVSWINGEEAVFVSSPRLQTPMAGGLVVYGSRAAAERAARELDGRVVASFAALVAAHGQKTAGGS